MAGFDNGNFNVPGTLETTKGADVASANDMTLGEGNFFDITGTTTINTIASKGIGTFVSLQFDGILQLTHSADLFLPTASNVTTAAGDVAVFYEYASGDWRCQAYTRADGTALASSGSGGSGTTIFLATADISTDASVIFNNTYITDTYKVYKLVFSDVIPSANDAVLKIELSNDNGSSWHTSGYLSNAGVTDTGVGARTATDSLMISDTTNKVDTVEGVSGDCMIFNPTNASKKTNYVGDFQYLYDSTTMMRTDCAGLYDTAEDNDAIKIYYDSTTLASGKISLYGIKES